MQKIIEATYEKKLCLPNYCNHTFAVTVRQEVPEESDPVSEAAKLYEALQTAVDDKLQAVGFVPDVRAYGHPPQTKVGDNDREKWACTDAQRVGLVDLAKSQKMSGTELNALSKAMFGKSAKQLTPKQATELGFELRKRRTGIPIVETAPDNPRKDA